MKRDSDVVVVPEYELMVNDNGPLWSTVRVGGDKIFLIVSSIHSSRIEEKIWWSVKYFNRFGRVEEIKINSLEILVTFCKKEHPELMIEAPYARLDESSGFIGKMSKAHEDAGELADRLRNT